MCDFYFIEWNCFNANVIAGFVVGLVQLLFGLLLLSFLIFFPSVVNGFYNLQHSQFCLTTCLRFQRMNNDRVKKVPCHRPMFLSNSCYWLQHSNKQQHNCNWKQLRWCIRNMSLFRTSFMENWFNANIHRLTCNTKTASHMKRKKVSLTKALLEFVTNSFFALFCTSSCVQCTFAFCKA